MLVSVIIPTCNRNNSLTQCLDLLAANIQTILFDKYEVIVTDDSKMSSAKELVETKYSWAKWVKGPKSGPASNRNNGAKYAKGEWLLFIDDDVVPDKALLENYYKAIISNKNVLAFEGAIYPDNEKLLKKDMAECPVNTEGNCFWSANICINTELFKNIGGFNEMYKIAAQEDQQMKIDIEKQSGKVRFLKDAFVIHPVRFTTIKKQLARMPAASKNFCLYAFENKDLLGYSSLSKFLLKQYSFYVTAVYQHLKKFNPKSCFVCIICCVYVVPSNVIRFHYLQKQSRYLK